MADLGHGLVALAGAADTPQPTMRVARRRGVLLFAIPAFFYIASLQIFEGATFGAVALTVVNAYSFAPFVLAAGIAAFPLVFVECAALLLVALAAQAFALHWHAGETQFITAEALWLQLMTEGVAAFAALSQRRLLAELVAQALKDPLTGCHRHEVGRELLEMHFHLARRRASPLAALFVDLDRFKRVNDELGHDAGDHALATAAATLRAGLRVSDVLVRWGGEEFVMILPDTGFSEAVAIAERVHDAVEEPDALIELADQRMYRAKRAGRDRCVWNGETHDVALA